MDSQVQNKSDLLGLIKAHTTAIKKFGVCRLGLFGSFARDEVHQNSDIDLLVEFEPHQKTYKNFIGFAFFAEKITGRNVEVITPQSLSPFLGPKILKSVEYVAL